MISFVYLCWSRGCTGEREKYASQSPPSNGRRAVRSHGPARPEWASTSARPRQGNNNHLNAQLYNRINFNSIQIDLNCNGINFKVIEINFNFIQDNVTPLH